TFVNLKNMKNLIYRFLILMMAGGCNDNLIQVNPTGPTGDDFFKNERDIQLAVVAAYGGLSNNGGVWGMDIWGFEAMSDNGYGIADAPYNNWDSFDHEPSSGLVRDLYG